MIRMFEIEFVLEKQTRPSPSMLDLSSQHFKKSSKNIASKRISYFCMKPNFLIV